VVEREEGGGRRRRAAGGGGRDGSDNGWDWSARWGIRAGRRERGGDRRRTWRARTGNKRAVWVRNDRDGRTSGIDRAVCAPRLTEQATHTPPLGSGGGEASEKFDFDGWMDERLGPPDRNAAYSSQVTDDMYLWESMMMGPTPRARIARGTCNELSRTSADLVPSCLCAQQRTNGNQDCLLACRLCNTPRGEGRSTDGIGGDYPRKARITQKVGEMDIVCRGSLFLTCFAQAAYATCKPTRPG